jgi:6-phosphogluconolactonase
LHQNRNGEQVKPNIVVSSNDKWAEQAVEIIGQAISSAISCRGVCHVMLTGGSSAERVYTYWARASALPLEKIHFLFGDERCVPPEHQDSNYGMAKRTLFTDGFPDDCRVERIRGEAINYNAESSRYESMLPGTIDVLLLSVGSDGHVASLFPGSQALHERKRLIMPVTSPKAPSDRLTITPRVIQSAKAVFLLVAGVEKGQVLAESLRQPENISSFPVNLTINGTWLLDQDAANNLKDAVCLKL